MDNVTPADMYYTCDIRRKIRKWCSAEDKIQIVLEGLKGEGSVPEICRRAGIQTNMFYKRVPGAGLVPFRFIQTERDPSLSFV